MKKTIYHGFLMPEGTDVVDVQNFNDNFEDVDEILHDLEQNTGDISKSTVNATIATTRTNVASGDSIGTIVGKIMKWLTDIKNAAFCVVANNLTTTAAGSVLDARQGKELNDSLTTHNTQLGGLYFGTNSAGKWGYKTSANGSVTPFRQPTGNAGTGDVLVGKTFANASSDSLTGTMPNNGSMTATLTPTGNNSVTKTIPAGYTTGGTITANGATAYAAGHAAALPKTVTRIATHLSQASTATIPSGCVAVVVLKPRSIDTISVNGSTVSPIVLSLDGAYDMPSGHEFSLCMVLNPPAGSLACIGSDGSSRTFEAWAVTY